ncbi:MAG: transporter substrate-binding domain-containing protein [Litoreibacter sp.]
MPNNCKKTAIAGVVLALTTVSASADDVIKFATEAAFPPFNERADDGSIIGFEIDLGNEMCARISRECEFVAQEWDGMIPGLLSKRFDGIFASMSITEERQKKIDFTDRYYKTPGAFVGPAGTEVDRSASDLGGLKVGTIPGTTECFVTKNYPDADLQIYRNAEDMFLDVQAGRIDVVLADSIQVDFGLLRPNPDIGYEFLGDPATDAECFGDGVGIGVRKDDPEMLALMNQAIAAVRADGTYDRLVEQYFGYDIYGE